MSYLRLDRFGEKVFKDEVAAGFREKTRRL